MAELCVQVQAGPDRGLTVELGADPITIGRGADRAVRLTDPAVSREHLTLVLERTGDGGATVRVLAAADSNPAWHLDAGDRRTLAVDSRVGVGVPFTLGRSTLVVRERAGVVPRPTAPSAHHTVELDAAIAPARPIAALAELGNRLARCGSLQAVYRTTAQWVVQSLPATRALLLSADGSDVLSAASEAGQADVALSQGLLRRVLADRRGVLVHNVAGEPDLANRHSIQMRDIRGAMAAPTQHLVLYAEWDTATAATGRHDEDSLALLVCAAQLVDALGHAAQERAQLRAVTRARSPSGDHPAVVGHSAALQRLHLFIEKVAPTPATVLFYGESGTGKELAARLIHLMSERAPAPFVAVNCAAIPEQLLESELFGHEKGAFTGAVAKHDGFFAQAEGGTLFLDEIGEMSAATQARMLRVLENRTFMRVGGVAELRANVRIVAATHRDLKAMTKSGAFREDLLYRLSVLQTTLPPLRERADDIPELVMHFAHALGDAMGRSIESVAPEAEAALRAYPWPGNVRELRNVVERALVLGDGPVLQPDDLPPELLRAGAPRVAGASSLHAGTGSDPAPGSITVRPLAELEREAIANALAATDGNKARAAALLGIDRTTLHRKLKAFESDA